MTRYDDATEKDILKQIPRDLNKETVTLRSVKHTSSNVINMYQAPVPRSLVTCHHVHIIFTIHNHDMPLVQVYV